MNDVQYIHIFDFHDYLEEHPEFALKFPWLTPIDIISVQFILILQGKKDIHLVYHPENSDFISQELWSIQTK